MTPTELPPRQREVLAAIAELTVPRGPSQHELARHLGIAQPTAGRAVFRLVKRGLVELPKRGRAQLTAAGERELEGDR